MRLFIILAGAAMAGSYFVTWLEPPLPLPELSPNGVIGEGLQDAIRNGPWQMWVFLGGFAAAGLAVLTALTGRGSGLMCLLAGISPAVLGLYYYSRADEFRANVGLPFEVDFQDLQAAYDVMGGFIAPGLWMYLGGAAVLLLAGLSMSMSRG